MISNAFKLIYLLEKWLSSPCYRYNYREVNGEWGSVRKEYCREYVKTSLRFISNVNLVFSDNISQKQAIFKASFDDITGEINFDIVHVGHNRWNFSITSLDYACEVLYYYRDLLSLRVPPPFSVDSLKARFKYDLKLAIDRDSNFYCVKKEIAPNLTFFSDLSGDYQIVCMKAEYIKCLYHKTPNTPLGLNNNEWFSKVTLEQKSLILDFLQGQFS